MDVGIITKYQRTDATYAAFQLADLAAAQGRVSFFSPNPNPSRLHTRWDNRLSRGEKLTEWIKRDRPEVVVWGFCPHAEQVAWANNNNIRTVLVATLCEPDDVVRECYRLFARVVAPSGAATEALGRIYRLPNVVPCPWSPCAVTTVKAPHSGPPRVYFPLYGALGWDVDADAVVRAVSRALWSTDAEVTVSYSNLHGGAKRRLRDLRQLAASRHKKLALVKATDYHAELARLASHDVTAVMSKVEPFGMAALGSLHMGTPVVCFSTPPLSEFVDHGANGLLVPCDPQADDGGRAREFEKFADRLILAISDPDVLARLGTRASTRLATRRANFAERWREILRPSS